eukprot:gene42500-26218_t
MDAVRSTIVRPRATVLDRVCVKGTHVGAAAAGGGAGPPPTGVDSSGGSLL